MIDFQAHAALSYAILAYLIVLLILACAFPSVLSAWVRLRREGEQPRIQEAIGVPNLLAGPFLDFLVLRFYPALLFLVVVQLAAPQILALWAVQRH